MVELVSPCGKLTRSPMVGKSRKTLFCRGMCLISTRAGSNRGNVFQESTKIMLPHVVGPIKSRHQRDRK